MKYKRRELTEERKRERLKLEGMVREEQRIKIGDMLGRDKVMRKRGKEGRSNEGFSYKQTAPPSGTFCICVFPNAYLSLLST